MASTATVEAAAPTAAASTLLNPTAKTFVPKWVSVKKDGSSAKQEPPSASNVAAPKAAVRVSPEKTVKTSPNNKPRTVSPPLAEMDFGAPVQQANRPCTGKSYASVAATNAPLTPPAVPANTPVPVPKKSHAVSPSALPAPATAAKPQHEALPSAATGRHHHHHNHHHRKAPHIKYTTHQLLAVKKTIESIGPNLDFVHHIMRTHPTIVNPTTLSIARSQEDLLDRFPYYCSKCAGLKEGTVEANNSGSSRPSSRRVSPQTTHQPLPPQAGVQHDPAALDGPCEEMGNLIRSVFRDEREKGFGFLLQRPDVVFGSVLCVQALDSVKTSRRFKTMKAKAPAAMKLIKEYVLGEGFHIAPPAIDNHAQWRAFMNKLKFDWIRDNKTHIYTELSKQWARRHSPFEQFAHFLFFRSDRPVHSTMNMLTHAEKPLIVSCIAGDVVATVLLGHLQYTVLPDAVWDAMPFLRQALDPLRYATLRHLCVYFFRRQTTRNSQVPPPIALPK